MLDTKTAFVGPPAMDAIAGAPINPINSTMLK